MTRNTSALHGLRSSRSGCELTIAVKQAVDCGTHLRWVAGTEQLADALTKGKAKKVLLGSCLRDSTGGLFMIQVLLPVGNSPSVSMRSGSAKWKHILCRRFRCSHLRTCFPWALEQDLVDPDAALYERLRSITGASSGFYLKTSGF